MLARGEHTADGELVQHYFRNYALADPSAVIALLRAAPEVTEDLDVLTYWEDDVAFKVFGSPIADVAEPAPETGVVWELCHEDRDDPPLLGERLATGPPGATTRKA